MNTYAVEEQFQVFVTLTFEEGESSASRTGRVFSDEIAPDNR